MASVGGEVRSHSEIHTGWPGGQRVDRTGSRTMIVGRFTGLGPKMQ